MSGEGHGLQRSGEPPGGAASGADATLAADTDIAVVAWPGEAVQRDELIRRGLARLVVVAAGQLPPSAPDGLEDWVRAGCDPVEVFVRKERLRRRQRSRAPVVLDDDGLLRRADRWVALSPGELTVARLLLQRAGSVVPWADLAAAVRPGFSADRRALDTVVRRVRRRIAPLGLAVHRVRAHGLLLELGELPAR